jgi:phosphopantetheine adenylyltransferase
VIESVADRISNVRSFVDLIRPTVNVHCEPIEDPCGPSATMPDLNVKIIEKNVHSLKLKYDYLVYYCY